MADDRAAVHAALKDAIYTAIGLAVLGLQRAQVCRRDVERLVRDAKQRLEAQERPAASR